MYYHCCYYCCYYYCSYCLSALATVYHTFMPIKPLKLKLKIEIETEREREMEGESAFTKESLVGRAEWDVTHIWGHFRWRAGGAGGVGRWEGVCCCGAWDSEIIRKVTLTEVKSIIQPCSRWPAVLWHLINGLLFTIQMSRTGGTLNAPKVGHNS